MTAFAEVIEPISVSLLSLNFGYWIKTELSSIFWTTHHPCTEVDGRGLASLTDLRLSVLDLQIPTLDLQCIADLHTSRRIDLCRLLSGKRDALSDGSEIERGRNRIGTSRLDKRIALYCRGSS